jgi:hypothetical protein
MDKNTANGGTMETKTPRLIALECVICGERTREGDVAEMHDPADPEERGGIVHPECGLSRDWQVS